jgi:hypothetical protein
MTDDLFVPEVTNPGAKIALDEIGVTFYPRTKIVIGADGVNDGDVSSANPLPVEGTVTANLSATDNEVLDAIQAAVETLDNAISGNEMQVDVLSSALPSGAATSANQSTANTALAAIQTAVEIIDNAISGSEMQVDLVSANVTNTGTFAVQAAQSGTWTVDLGATDNAVLDAIETAVELIDDAVYTGGSGTPSKGLAILGSDGTNPRFITVDASGHVQVDVLSTALPSGAATAANQTTIIGHVDGIESSLSDVVTALQIMDDWDETNRAKVNLIVGQAGVSGGAGAVDATTLRTVAATDDPGVALLTTIDVDTGNIATAASAIQTAVQLIDNGVYVDDADWTATSSSHYLIGGVYQSTPGSITDGDTGPLRLTQNGAAHVAVQNTITVASHAVTNAGTFAVQAAQSGTWTVDLGATDNAVLDAIQTATASAANSLALIDNAVSGASLAVSIATALQTGTNTIGVVMDERVSTSTLSNVSGSASSVQLLASTAGRKAAYFHNDSTATAYVKFGTTASTTSYTVKMAPDSFYEIPQPVYTGRIDAIWSAANGSMRITELT